MADTGVLIGRSVRRFMDPNQKAHITPSLDGPYWVTDLTRFANRTGPIRIRPSMALCRCGVSANKPFCDGTHRHIGFKDERN